MKRSLFLKLLILLLIPAFAAPEYPAAQDANSARPTEQTAETLGENERLPFMQTENSAEMQPETGSGALLLRTLGAMILIIGLLFFGVWGAKKLGFGGFNSNVSDDHPDLNILSSVSLGNGRTISAVRFGERILLVGSTPQSVTLLAEETGSQKVSPAGSRSVAEMLAEENNSFDDEFQQAQIRLNTWQKKGGEN